MASEEISRDSFCDRQSDAYHKRLSSQNKTAVYSRGTRHIVMSNPILFFALKSLVRTNMGDIDFDVEYDLCYALEKWMHIYMEEDLSMGYTEATVSKRKAVAEDDYSEDYTDDDPRFIKRRKVGDNNIHFIDKDKWTS